MIYLDNAATTQPNFFAKDYSYNWMNSNSNYAMSEKKDLEDARQRIMDCLKVKTGKILFCRCATEAVEWLYNFWAQYIDTGHGDLFCSHYEHDSVFNLCYDDCEVNDYELGDSDFYLHQYVNQLTGTIYDIKTIGKKVQATGAYFGSDFTAAIGHIQLPNNLDEFCDAVWFSGHKFGAEKGIGAIWISDRLFKSFNGNEDSKNEYGLIHGTVNVASTIAMSWAMKVACENIENDKFYNYYLDLYFNLIEKLKEANIKFFDVGDKDKASLLTVCIFSLVLDGINADALQNYLASNDIYIGIGASACADEKDYRVLKAYGLSDKEAESTIRISFSPDNIEEDIDKLIEYIIKFKEMFT